MHIDLHGKLVLVRYGMNFRGVKAYVAQQYGAAGLIIYSDPADDGYYKGDKYPRGPYRPDTGVQRGSIQFMFKYPGDATTPGIASTVDLPESKRTPPDHAPGQPSICSTTRSPTTMPRPSSKLSTDPTCPATGKARCPSITTWGPAA